ncbi:IS4 family transposase [Paenibacillus sp. HWE-109]|uniref:IS4 family transposase n=1 Tax=Paenibacillus sp. HWE-109 TaxID=1306526 RepID=UPI001EDF1009|nr:IS4 family transposase [Paenibacillus sp. HWE-109]UKS27135.1 IS4 family transposase [Paenibacillus sp. HWE-109]
MGIVPDKTVISQCLQLLDLPKAVCDILDYRTQKLTVRSAILLFIEAQLARREEPTAIEEHLRSNENLQALVGTKSISASRFSRKLNELPTFLLQYAFQEINRRIAQTLRESSHVKVRDVKKLTIIDSTTISLPNFHGQWAYCSKTQNSVKMHTYLCTDFPDMAYPSKVILSTGAVADSEVAIELLTDKNTTYVMDRGYINYAFFKKWAEANIRFVVRIQANSKTTVIQARPVPEDDPGLLRDADVQMVVPKHPDQKVTLRLVEFKDDKKRIYRVVTTRWDLSAREIANLYRDRWMIELFFKWMKQHLHLAKLYSYKPDAVWNQIYMTLLAYGLCILVKLQTKTTKSTWEVLKLVRIYVMMSWEKFLAALNRAPTRSSKGRRKKNKGGRPRIHPIKKKAQKKKLEQN